MQQNPYNSLRTPPRIRKSLFVRILPWFLLALGFISLIIFGLKTLRDNKIAREIAPYENLFADNIIIDGLNISRMTPQEASEAIYRQHEERVNSWQVQISYKGHIYVTVNYMTLGLGIDRETTNKALEKAWSLTHQGNDYQKKEAIEELLKNPYEDFTIQSNEFSSQKLDQILASISANISQISQPSDAKLIQFVPDNLDPFLIQKEQIGYSLDIEHAKKEILALASSGTSGNYELQPDPVMPDITEALLRKNLVLRSIAQTEISTQSQANRTENIRVSTSKINGLILEPGQEFRFNKIAQERTMENGYFPAEEQVYGYLETGVGGGVCQTSSTIYQAALLADLSITRRSSHGEPVGYTDAGLDATVYLTRDRELDFRFKNSTNSTLYIAARVKPGSSSRHLITEVRIYGEPFNDGAQYKLKTVKTEIIYPSSEPLYVPDNKSLYTLYKDEEVQKSAPKEGSNVETYLQKYINGQLVQEKFIAKSTYPARQEQIWRGVKNRPSI